MTDNPHFQSVSSWKDARQLLSFKPLEPKTLAGRRLRSLSIHVRDPKGRELPVADRSLEAHYDDLVFTQAWKTIDEARRLVLDVSYGSDGRCCEVAGRTGRVYELGPIPPADDIDPRSPSVVVWHDGEVFLLLASGELPSAALLSIAETLYG